MSPHQPISKGIHENKKVSRKISPSHNSSRSPVCVLGSWYHDSGFHASRRVDVDGGKGLKFFSVKLEGGSIVRASRLEELQPPQQIKRIAESYGVDPNLMLKIAKCENGTYQPDRKNYAWPQITASGAFMFTNPTWIATRSQMGLPDPNLTLKHDFIENTKTAAWKIANGGIGAWNQSKSCWNI